VPGPGARQEDRQVVVGLGTLLNVAAIIVGSAIGLAFGDRLPSRTRDVVTDGLGLVTLLVGAVSAAAVLDPALRDAVGQGVPVLVVLGAVLLGGIVGSLLRLEDRLEQLGGWLQRWLGRSDEATGGDGAAPDAEAPAEAEGTSRRRASFVEGFVDASLVFCIGPLALLGALNDGLGRGIDQLALKSVLDGFLSIAFAASLGAGVMASAGAVLVYQGFWTVVGWRLGGVLGPAENAALTATGGLLLVGVSLRLLRIRQVPVGDLLPALVIAPALAALVAALR
jgi:uncharacterized membrane protein YqgA involved in biofilm formation